MQNVSRDEEAELLHRVGTDEADMEDTLKANALGLVLMSIVGDKVLTAAADAARSIIEHGVLGEVYPRLHDVLESAAPSDAARRLDVLGITLHTAWPNIPLVAHRRAQAAGERAIDMRVLDPDFLKSDPSSWYDPLGRGGGECRLRRGCLQPGQRPSSFLRPRITLR